MENSRLGLLGRIGCWRKMLVGEGVWSYFVLELVDGEAGV